MQDLEDQMQKLPFLQELRATQDPEEWYEARPYLLFPEERRVNNLTAGVLRGPGKLAVHALVRARKDEKESYVILHVGRALCGHDGIVHGGLLATLLDESLARNVSTISLYHTFAEVSQFIAVLAFIWLIPPSVRLLTPSTRPSTTSQNASVSLRP